MKKRSIQMAVTGLLGGLMLSSSALAGVVVINDEMTRRGALTTSGSLHTVEQNCEITAGLVDPSGNAWQGATADVMVRQVGSGSTVDIKVRGAVPDTLFTVWVRIKGKNGLNDGTDGSPPGSPLTGGGATPLAPGSELNALNDISPWNNLAGASYSANSFMTDTGGEGNFAIDLDFPVVRGAYPFQMMVGSARPGHDGHADVPTAIADPREPGQGSTPFLFRVVSHCLDNKSHGLSPGAREAWFQYP